MKIDRQNLIVRYNPKLDGVDTASPLTVGNGEFAFTADVTGLQSLYEEYREECPLCTLSQWGWHTAPVSSERYAYTLDDLKMTEFDYRGRTVRYPKDCFPGDEEVYHWLRQNPHRLNLGRISLLYEDREIKAAELSKIHQELHLYEGRLESRYELGGEPCRTQVCCDSQSDTLGIRLSSRLFAEKRVAVCITFPYGSPDITASDWEKKSCHTTSLVSRTEGKLVFRRVLDKDCYYVTIRSAEPMEFDGTALENHCLKLYGAGGSWNLAISFTRNEEPDLPDCASVFENAEGYWKNFWEQGGMVQFSSSTDIRAEELQRRVLLSMYLLAVNCSGSMPPQETGLTCNSWYGKMHLEMHFWHSAWAPLWNHAELLERSMPWYLEHRKEARDNAARNGFAGIRWPKMIGYSGEDSPSNIAPMLIWQQPHILFMLELLYRNHPNPEFLEKYWELVKETADFMADFAVYEEADGRYDLLPPLIPVQECHEAEVSKNPAFEVEYWRFGLSIAAEWAGRLGKTPDRKWLDVYENMREPGQKDGRYLAHEGCEDTFTRFRIDHPSMLGMLGVLPSERIDEAVMERTLDSVIQVWKYESLWGWDFAVMAMTAARLHKPELAVDCLLKEAAKNEYVRSGNNRQSTRKDLPLYLPGNGSLLLAVALMAAGGSGLTGPAPGFPDAWEVVCENMEEYV
ncbi:MAG: glycoside hydrolase family 65 [Lachnospiraceae bacterium]|nr:glycoside hydrolase family 65 [Lachnospiraceae bacterium]